MYEVGKGTAAEQEAARLNREAIEHCRTPDGFRALLAEGYQAARIKRETEAAIERRLAAAWFAAHPYRACQCRQCVNTY